MARWGDAGSRLMLSSLGLQLQPPCTSCRQHANCRCTAMCYGRLEQLQRQRPQRPLACLLSLCVVAATTQPFGSVVGCQAATQWPCCRVLPPAVTPMPFLLCCVASLVAADERRPPPQCSRYHLHRAPDRRLTGSAAAAIWCVPAIFGASSQ